MRRVDRLDYGSGRLEFPKVAVEFPIEISFGSSGAEAFSAGINVKKNSDDQLSKNPCLRRCKGISEVINGSFAVIEPAVAAEV